MIALAPPGRARLVAALPLWRAAQAESAGRLDEAPWPEVRAALDTLA